MATTTEKANEYHAQADAFMADTGTTLAWEFDGFRKHLPDDKEARNCWRFTLTRNGREYSATFGQSLAESRTTKRRLTVPPHAYDLLAGIQKDDPGSFHDFCASFGYDEDSRKAEATHRAVMEEWHGVDRLFHDVLDRLQEIA